VSISTIQTVAQGFTGFTMTAIKKNPRATKCSDKCTISLVAHRAKTVVMILRRWIEGENEDVLREDQLGFRKGKLTRNANGMLRIISE
jgi:hypothetical protein